MNCSELTGTIGVALILLAYFCNVFRLIATNGKIFFLLNLVGAGLACYASVLINYFPFVILEAIWALVSVAGLYKVIYPKQPA
jgi:hypothetical protein